MSCAAARPARARRANAARMIQVAKAGQREVKRVIEKMGKECEGRMKIPNTRRGEQIYIARLPL